MSCIVTAVIMTHIYICVYHLQEIKLFKLNPVELCTLCTTYFDIKYIRRSFIKVRNCHNRIKKYFPNNLFPGDIFRAPKYNLLHLIKICLLHMNSCCSTIYIKPQDTPLAKDQKWLKQIVLAHFRVTLKIF